MPIHVIVHMRPENPPAAAAGYVYMGNGVLPIAPPLHDPRPDAVLLLDPTGPARSDGGQAAPRLAGGAAGGPTPAPVPVPVPVDVRLYGARLLPEVIVAPPSAPVVFRNDERRPLTLRCRNAPELFPAASLGPGLTLSVTPPGPGEFEVRSVEYPHLRATVLVPRGPATRLKWSPAGEVGVARLSAPPGTYLARLFFLHRYVAAQTLVVPEAKPAATAAPAAAPGGQPVEFVLRAVWPTATLAAAAPSRPDPVK